MSREGWACAYLTLWAEWGEGGLDCWGGGGVNDLLYFSWVGICGKGAPPV